MDSLIQQIIQIIVNGGDTFFAVGGWLLYLLERYYFLPLREKQYRGDLSEWRAAFDDVTKKTSEALSRLSHTLEVLKDRGERK
jgi:hypothetical protein